MKAQQRFHLNRLAEKLVTPERFDDDPIDEATLAKWRELHEGADDLRARMVEVAPGIEQIFPDAESAAAARRAHEKSRCSAR